MSALKVNDSKGFTLVEVMVAMAVLSLIMLATITGLRTLGNTQVAIDKMTQRVDELRTISSFLRDTLESTIVGQSSSGLSLGGSGSSNKSMFFELSATSLTWKSSILFGEGYGGTHLLRIAQEDDELVLRWQIPPANGQPEEWEDAPSRIMVHRLEEMEVSYRREFDGEWSEEWDRRGLPALVRARFKVAGRYWPDLVFEVPR
ncbi:MAG: general secretion pathway protein J [Halieaceae bacterium]|jgi:general secretion pathway protein J